MYEVVIYFYRGRHAGKIVRITAGTGELALAAVRIFVCFPENHFLILEGAALARLPSEPPVSLEFQWQYCITLQYMRQDNSF